MHVWALEKSVHLRQCTVYMYMYGVYLCMELLYMYPQAFACLHTSKCVSNSTPDASVIDGVPMDC